MQNGEQKRDRDSNGKAGRPSTQLEYILLYSESVRRAGNYVPFTVAARHVASNTAFLPICVLARDRDRDRDRDADRLSRNAGIDYVGSQDATSINA